MGQDLAENRMPSNLSPAVMGAEPSFLNTLSPSVRAVEAVIRELAQNRVPVLLLAEPGAGKRTTARRIHALCGHPPEKFLVLSCVAVTPDQLAPSQDAWQQAGTVFLEEVGDLTAECQTKLVEGLSHVDNNNEDARNPGGPRLVCGSSRDLESEVRSGRFREDLYYRISGVCLRLPPLRQRKEDVLALTRFFLTKHAEELRRPVPAMSAQTQQLFQEYAWPGNIRELEDATRAIVVLGDEAVAMGGLRAMLTKPDRSGNGERVSLKEAARAASREAEKKLILKVLTRTRWNRRRAAQELQISYKALLYKLKQIGCEYEAS